MFNMEKANPEKRRLAMGDKGMKDKNKHNKQVNKAKNTKNEANKKKQERTP